MDRPNLPLEYFHLKSILHNNINGFVEVHATDARWHSIVDAKGESVGRIVRDDIERAHLLWCFCEDNRPYDRTCHPNVVEWMKWRYEMCHNDAEEMSKIRKGRKAASAQQKRLKNKQIALDNQLT